MQRDVEMRDLSHLDLGARSDVLDKAGGLDGDFIDARREGGHSEVAGGSAARLIHGAGRDILGGHRDIRNHGAGGVLHRSGNDAAVVLGNGEGCHGNCQYKATDQPTKVTSGHLKPPEPRGR